jgi:ABC-type multidrug transport system ATPase subunit
MRQLAASAETIRPVDGPALEGIGLTADGPGAEAILRGVDLSVAPGEGVWIVGANGVGKSLLLACLSGAVKPKAGQVRAFGADLALGAARKLARRRMGIVTETPVLDLGATLRDNITLAALTTIPNDATPAAPGDITALIKYFGLESLALTPVASLAAPKRRLIAMACAAVRKPSLLLIDSPFAGLDATARGRVARLLVQLRALGAAIVLAGERREGEDVDAWPERRLENGRLAEDDIL